MYIQCTTKILVLLCFSATSLVRADDPSYPVFRGTVVFADGWVSNFGEQPKPGDYFVIDVNHLISEKLKYIPFSAKGTPKLKSAGEISFSKYLPVGAPFKFIENKQSADEVEFRLLSERDGSHLPVVIDIVRRPRPGATPEFSIHIRSDTFGKRLGSLIVIHAAIDKPVEQGADQAATGASEKSTGRKKPKSEAKPRPK